MLAYVSKFTSGGLEPFWPHFVLLTFSVVGSVAVGVGILLERPKYSAAVHRIATGLVISGVVVEAICTIALFVFDEGISQAQQSKIIALEAQLTGFLEPRKLTQGQKTRIIQAIKPFPPVSFVAMFAPGEESWEFVLDISRTLRDAGWDWEPYPSGQGIPVWRSIDPNAPPEGEIMADHIVLVASPELRAVAQALAGALIDPGVIGMETVTVQVDSTAAKLRVIAGTKR
jgi:hypothetical protein